MIYVREVISKICMFEIKFYDVGRSSGSAVGGRLTRNFWHDEACLVISDEGQVLTVDDKVTDDDANRDETNEPGRHDFARSIESR
jgi:hypothetical protein